MNKKRADDFQVGQKIKINGVSRTISKILVMEKTNEIQLWTETTCTSNLSKLYQILVCGRGEMVQYFVGNHSKKWD